VVKHSASGEKTFIHGVDIISDGFIFALRPFIVSETPKQSKTTSRLVVNKGSNSCYNSRQKHGNLIETYKLYMPSPL
jgi:hypothetical protein